MRCEEKCAKPAYRWKKVLRSKHELNVIFVWSKKTDLVKSKIFLAY